MELKRVVVTGLGAITPIGNTVSEFWDGVVGGKSGAGPITRFDTEKFKVKFACEVKGFDPSLYIDPKDARKMDLFTQYSISVAAQAIDDAHLDTSKLNLDKVGVIFGVGIGGIITFEQEMTNYALNKEMGPRFNPFFIPKMISDIAPGMISIRYGFRVGQSRHNTRRRSRSCRMRGRDRRILVYARSVDPQRLAADSIASIL